MIQSLKTTIEKLEKEHAKRINAVRISNDLKLTLPLLDHQRDNISSQTYLIYIYYNRSMDEIEQVELDIIPQISTLTGSKWSRYVSADEIRYTISFKYSRIDCAISITISYTDSCKITKIPTGRTQEVYKTVTVTEPIYETVINCS